MSRDWDGDGPEFGLSWGGRAWTLRVGGLRPGLYRDGIGPLMGLEGVAAAGRWSPSALSGATLVGWGRRLDRVEATYAPLGWSSLTTRAAWSPRGEDGVDLEVQVSTRSVGRLKAVEVWLLSTLAESPPLAGGGELREPEAIGPRQLAATGDLAGRGYVEMAHPQDVSRWSDDASTLRCGLFGHDLERGVVLRGRLRGLWLTEPVDRAERDRRFAEFLHGPPPLST